MAMGIESGFLPGAGLPRREFLKAMTLAAAAVGLPGSAVAELVSGAGTRKKPSVIWLHFQECTGCTESLLRTTHPDIGSLILNLVSLDYHETLFVAAGHQAEQARKSAMAANAGKYVLVVEGAVPTRDGGIYCKIGGQTAQSLLEECAAGAGAVIAIGSCASWGGLSSTTPNPTGASGIRELVKGKPVVSIPGCPPNPYNFLGTVLQYATYGTLPALDEQGRPKFAYARTIHEDCPRRAHFDAGRFAEKYGDAGHRDGWCLYKLGCKGPVTHANCSVQSFSELPGVWPVGIGHPCFGCTEKGVGFNLALNTTVPIGDPTASTTFAAVHGGGGQATAAATGVGGAILGAAIAAGYRFSKTLDAEEQAGTSGEKES